VLKYRKRALCGKIGEFVGKKLREFASQKGCAIEKGYTVQDHVYILISIPPKFGYLYFSFAGGSGTCFVGIFVCLPIYPLRTSSIDLSVATKWSI
jgi:hypothetical protein